MTLKLSHSKVKTWRRCHRAYHYKYTEKLRKKTKARPLMMGSLIHEVLELELQGKPFEHIFNKYQKEIRSIFEEERAEFDLDSVVPNARIIMDGYLKFYKQDPVEYLAIEKEVQAELIPGVIVEGKIDGIVRKKSDGRVFIFERKTCKQMPKEDVRLSDIQSVIYYWLLPASGYRRKLDGIMWDYVRSKPPTVPELLKKGSLSLANIETTPEVYLEAIKKHKLKPQDYAEMLKKLELKRSQFFKRVPLPYSNTLRDNIVSDLKDTAKEILTFGEVLKDRNLGRDCSWCEFYSLCQSELRGLDSDFIRRKEYEVKKREEIEKTNPNDEE